jgi:hypothetical protein
VSHIQGGLDAIQSKAKTLPSPRVLVIMDRRQGMLTDLIAIGPNNYVNQIMEIANTREQQTVGGNLPPLEPGLVIRQRIPLEEI